VFSQSAHGAAANAPTSFSHSRRTVGVRSSATAALTSSVRNFEDIDFGRLEAQQGSRVGPRAELDAWHVCRGAAGYGHVHRHGDLSCQSEELRGCQVRRA